MITGTTTADGGKYTCMRANDAGNVSGEAYLTVLGLKLLNYKTYYQNFLSIINFIIANRYYVTLLVIRYILNSDYVNPLIKYIYYKAL